MGEVWAAEAIVLSYFTELDFTDYSMGFGEIKFLKWHHVNNSNSWFMANFKWLFRRFVFIQAIFS